MTTKTFERTVIYTDRFNSLGDPLVVFNGVSDLGTWGWFVGVEARVPGREPFLETRVFFTTHRAAIMDAFFGEHYGFAPVADGPEVNPFTTRAPADLVGLPKPS